MLKHKQLFSSGLLHMCPLGLEDSFPTYPQVYSFALLFLISEVFQDYSLTLPWFFFPLSLTPSEILAILVLYLSPATRILAPWGQKLAFVHCYILSLGLCLKQSGYTINTYGKDKWMSISIYWALTNVLDPVLI